MLDLVIQNARLVIPHQGIFLGAVGVRDGQIAAIVGRDTALPAAEVVDAGGCYLLPGRIEPHAHVGYMRAPEDDYLSETRSAAAGGTTTMLTFLRRAADYREFLPDLLCEFEARAHVDFALHLGMQLETHVMHLDDYVRDFGITSFKFFPGYRSEDGKKFGHTADIDDGLICEAMQALAAHDNTLFMAHCENPEITARCTRRVRAAGGADLVAWEAGRPAIAEAEQNARYAYLARVFDCQFYAVHVTCREALHALTRARAAGTRICIETCHHYLVFTRESNLGVLGTVNPPLRSADDVEALWRGLTDGVVDTVGADHAYIARAHKQGDIWTAAIGVGQGVATVLPILYTYGVAAGKLSMERLAEVTSWNVARAFGLWPRKGTIALGADADLVVLDPDLERVVEPAILQSDADYSIYDGLRLRGWPVLTVVRGHIVMRDGRVVGQPGVGRYLRRVAAPAGALRRSSECEGFLSHLSPGTVAFGA